MDPAYFVGRKEILTWINDTFDLSVGKIEDTASGAVACQVLDAIYPGEVNMSKVKWDARSDHEFINNYKIVQRVFEKRGVEKHVEVEKLVRAKYQDNLEFMQWLKSFFDKNYSGAPYDPVTRRQMGKGGSAVPTNAGGGGIKKPAPRPSAAAPKPAVARGSGAVASGGPVEEPSADPLKGKASGMASKRSHGPPSSHPSGGSSITSDAPALAKRVEALDVQVADLKLSVEGLEKERDFYFGKLRDIEILLQAYEGPDKDLSKQIFDILYATEEDFVVADDTGAADKENLS